MKGIINFFKTSNFSKLQLVFHLVLLVSFAAGIIYLGIDQLNEVVVVFGVMVLIAGIYVINPKKF